MNDQTARVIVVAPDSFKGCLTSAQVAHHLAEGLRAGLKAGTASPQGAWRVDELPLSDGGEGFVDSLLAAKGGCRVAVTVTGPLGRPVEAFFGLLTDGPTAVIEMAAAAGWHLIPEAERDPWRTTTRGVGELIRAALDHGARRLVIGLGGSGTHDGGAGMAQALGIQLLQADGRPIPPGAAGLTGLAKVDTAGLDPRLRQVEIVAAHDVNNPLTGPQGAAAVYGPQKGARPEDIPRLDEAVARFAQLTGKPGLQEVPGAGAAGGLGFALAALLGARLTPGGEWLLAEIGAAQRFAEAALVITGEGRMDESTRHGKLPVVVARTARTVGTPVVAVCGALMVPSETFAPDGIEAVFSISPRPMELAKALAQAPQFLRDQGYSLARLLGLCPC